MAQQWMMTGAGSRAPTVPGWYPVLKCWDPEEGAMPAGDYCDGGRWRSGALVVGWLTDRFESEVAASDWAYKNDPDSRYPHAASGRTS